LTRGPSRTTTICFGHLLLIPRALANFFISSKLNFNVIDTVEASTTPAALLDAHPQKSTKKDNQLWKFVSDGSGWGFLESKLNSNLTDIQEDSTQPKAFAWN
jgi:hypothetical protein